MLLAEELNSRIEEFVCSTGNSHLRPGTGSYSTHFRGKLFGERLASKVESNLTSGRRVEVLLLGANPNCPESQKSIAGERTDSDWTDFQRQSQSDEFAHVEFQASAGQRRWDPLHDPASLGPGQQAWTFYADCIRQSVDDFEAVALANVLPWGSDNVDAPIRVTRNKDSQLPGRMLKFANEQLELIIQRLRPKVVVCPKSIGAKPWARDLCVSMNRVTGLTDIGPHGLKGRRYPLFRGNLQEPFGGIPILFIGHPSALRFTQVVDRPRIADSLQHALRSALSEGAT